MHVMALRLQTGSSRRYEMADEKKPLWHSSLTMKNRNDLERCQKTSLRLILGPKYNNYEQALKYLHIDSLDQRREKLCLSFAKKCIKLNNMKLLFPILKKKHDMETRL